MIKHIILLWALICQIKKRSLSPTGLPVCAASGTCLRFWPACTARLQVNQVWICSSQPGVLQCSFQDGPFWKRITVHCLLQLYLQSVRLLFLILWLTYHLQEALCCSGWSPRICWNAAFIMPLPLAIPKTIVCTTTSSGSGELFQSTALPQDLAENIPLSSIPFSVGCSMPTWPCAGSPRKADPLKPLYSYSLLLS